jgi:hypothetical protein
VLPSRLDGQRTHAESVPRPGPAHSLSPLIAAAVCLVWASAVISLTRNTSPMPPDTAEYASIARNLLEGRGYTMSMVAGHTIWYDQVQHVPEMHGLLRPLAIAPLFWLFGLQSDLLSVPGILYQAGTAFLAFLLGRRIFGDLAGAIAGALFLISPLGLLAALLGHDDIGFAFFFMAALLALVAGLERRRGRCFVLAGVLGALAMLEKPTGFILPGIFLGSILVPLLRREWTLPDGIRACSLSLAPLALGFGCYLLRNFATSGQLGFRMGAYDWLFKIGGYEAIFALHDPLPGLGEVLGRIGFEGILRIWGQQLLYFAQELYAPAFANPLAVSLRELVIGLVALPLAWRASPRYGWVCALSIAGAVAFICGLYHVESRYFLFLVPLLSIGVGGGLAWLWRSWDDHRRLARALAASLALVALIVAGQQARDALVALDVQAPAGFSLASDPCAEATQWIASEAPADARVLTVNPWGAHWYTRREAVMIPSGPIEDALRVARHYRTGLLIDDSLFAFPSASASARRMARNEVPGASAERLAGNDACAVYRLELADQVGFATPR